MSQFKIKRKPTFNHKAQLGQTMNRDGSSKISQICPHHQAAITGEEWMEHVEHLPKNTSLMKDSDCAFARYHFIDETEAERCLASLVAAGGFGLRIKKSIRIMCYWEETLLRLLPEFQTGPVELSDSDMQYDNPEEHAETLW